MIFVFVLWTKCNGCRELSAAAMTKQLTALL
jgi:hypothetical protein